MTDLLRILIGVVPVFAFLSVLVFLDSYKLVSKQAVGASILWGAAAAALCLFANAALLELSGLKGASYSRYIAPVVEELVKAVYLVLLLRLKRIGFTVDAAIHGFAIGAGFALVENLYYLFHIEDSNYLVWIIRGFGTAAMHSTTVALVGIISKSLMDRYLSERIHLIVPGITAAIVVHSAFNHFVVSPVITTLGLLVILPLLLLWVFDRSERATRDWLGLGFDADQELLDILTSGRIADSKVGRYLETLRSRFPGEVVVDMFCLLRIHTELSLRAKGVLMLQQAGIKPRRDPETDEKFAEMRFLEKSIGPTGKLAILPFLYTNSREIWQLQKIR